jgi:8-oxo-dGTP diphosphatase
MNRREGVVCFLVRNERVLLALIEYPDKQKFWNGLGGYIEDGESLKDAVIREIFEETDIVINQEELVKMAEIKLNSDLLLHVFIVNNWSCGNTIKDKTIKELKWFYKNNLPYKDMHENNNKWLPYIMDGKKIKYQRNITLVDGFADFI